MSAPSEREFLERRLKIVEERLEQVSEYDVDDDGRFHLRYQHVPTKEYALVREARLLEKLLAQVSEGKIPKALRDWRKALGEKLSVHREFYRPIQEEYERWLSFPFPTRIEIPEPPQPPELDIIDSQQGRWLVDEELLDVLDDLKSRLEKWKNS